MTDQSSIAFPPDPGDGTTTAGTTTAGTTTAGTTTAGTTTAGTTTAGTTTAGGAAAFVVRRASRRTLFRAAGLVAIGAGTAAAAAACSTPSQTVPAYGGATPTPTQLPTSSVPVGGGQILTDADYVVTQPVAGTFKAFSKICTHQGCVVGEITGGNIVCDCHGSEFSIVDGSVVRGPATRPLPTAAVAKAGDTLTITPEPDEASPAPSS